MWVPKYAGVAANERCKLYCRVSGSAAFYMLKDKASRSLLCETKSEWLGGWRNSVRSQWWWCLYRWDLYAGKFSFLQASLLDFSLYVNFLNFTWEKNIWKLGWLWSRAVFSNEARQVRHLWRRWQFLQSRQGHLQWEGHFRLQWGLVFGQISFLPPISR